MDAKSTTLVLLGRTGNGKSSTGNSILGRYAFNSVWSSSSVTKECQLESRTWSDGRIINVIDTPGMCDTNSCKEDIDRKIVQCINLAKDGVHGFLLAVSVSKRFTDEEADVIDSLAILFGLTIINYMVVVFTGGDKLKKNCITLEKHLEQCPTSLKRVINRCHSRMLVFNNKKPSENQITELMAQVDRIVADNGNQPYSNDLFNKAQMMTSELYHIKDKEKLYVAQIKRLNEMMQENMRAMQENTCAQEERMREVRKELEVARSARPNASSGIAVDNECKLKFLELKSKRTHRFITFKIDDKLNMITVDKLGNLGQTYDAFIAALPEKECRYAVYDFDFLTEENCLKGKIFFIAWSSDTAKVRNKKLYARSKDRFRRELDGVQCEVQATDASEIGIENIRDKARYLG